MLPSLAGVLVALLVAGGMPATPPDSPAPSVETPSWRLAEQRVIEISDGQPVALSPDGHWLAVFRQPAEGVEICAYDAATLAAHRCAELPKDRFSPQSVAWSPDGRRLAFTEDSIFARESDIWTFEVDGGTVANLTDDGVSGDLLKTPTATIDSAPAWSPDGRELAFVRVGIAPEPPSTAIYRIAATGGEPALVHRVAGHAWAVDDRIWWSSTEEVIVYTAGLLSADELSLGVYAVPAAGGEPREIGDDLALYLNDPVVADVSARGTALVSFRAALQDPARIPAFGLLDLATGVLETLEPTNGEPANAVLWGAGFSPDGLRLLLAYSDQMLVVRDLDSGLDTILGELSSPFGERLIWAANDLVFTRGWQGTGLLVQLAEDSSEGTGLIRSGAEKRRLLAWATDPTAAKRGATRALVQETPP
jgi:dipeptidyl aminopeptidase/acylaminoacyl peptidase